MSPSDDRCRQCGYDLHGQTSAGRCPECGLSVGQTRASTADDAAGRTVPLTVASRAWLRRLARGGGAICLGSLGLAAFSVAGIHFALTGVPAPLVLYVALTLAAASLACLAIGGWWLTGREPFAVGRRSDRRARAIARWTPLAAAPAAVLLVAVSSNLDQPAGHLAAAWTWRVVAVASTFAALAVVASLGRRAGRPAIKNAAILCGVAQLFGGFAEGLIDPVFYGREAWTTPWLIPLAGDPFAPSILVATERFRPRVDGGTAAIGVGAAAWAATLVMWAVTWQTLVRAAAAPVADALLTPAGVRRSTAPSSRP